MRIEHTPENAVSTRLSQKPAMQVVVRILREAVRIPFVQTRKWAPVVAPVALVSLCLANCGFGCTPASDEAQDTRAGLERQRTERCRMTAQIQCPLQCNQIDFDAVCDANLGAGCDAQCDTSATGTCLDNCNADCAVDCQANAETACDVSCHSMCGDNCVKVCVGAPFPTACANSCKSECGNLCGDQCANNADSSCDGKCGASCNATCSVEAHVACELRCSVDAWTTCKATVQATCMANCSTDLMLTCADALDPAWGDEPAVDGTVVTTPPLAPVVQADPTPRIPEAPAPTREQVMTGLSDNGRPLSKPLH